MYCLLIMNMDSFIFVFLKISSDFYFIVPKILFEMAVCFKIIFLKLSL